MIVAGFGFRAEATLSALQEALASAQHGQPRVTLLATPQGKAALVERLAEAINVPLVAILPDALRSVQTPTQSTASLEARQTGSVAEACALAAAGPGARLLSLRHISPDRMATCAIARSGTQGPAA
ncbi:cobalamin biosynthesis protein [Sphingomonas sp. OK281]|uniref:cobalamin biosynthesis protein n=1 Tax=Sphingomonas sp. OK281 TaxID=1881067 RepID=UPI0008E6DC32|nr:cobalamin biosynthesis protein [Sphingomonas sp. OK281]SFN79820.1 cobalt-precorrin 5A hydrolase [Sphingomonas sp. OK281]